MKKFLLFSALAVLVVSCSKTDGIYKKTILDYLQIDDGVKTDMKIEFQRFESSDITVADSVGILQEQYKTEKQKKVELAQKSVSYWEEVLAKHQGKGNDLVVKALASNSQKELDRAKIGLTEAEEWVADYCNRYDDRSDTEIIARKIETYFSFLNPHLAQPSRQELGAIFILSPDGTRCYKMIKSK